MKIYCLLILLALSIITANKKYRMVSTIITGWWPEPGTSDLLPKGEDLKAFEKLLNLPHNMVIYGTKELCQYVAGKRDNSKTQINYMSAKHLLDSWYYKRVKEL